MLSEMCDLVFIFFLVLIIFIFIFFFVVDDIALVFTKPHY